MTLVAFLDKVEDHSLVAREPDPNDEHAEIVQLTPVPRTRRSSRFLGSRGRSRKGLCRAPIPKRLKWFRTLLTRMRGNIARTEPGKKLGMKPLPSEARPL